ncbi:MAG: pilus assembly protein [Planctomyces sp.]|nr:pilus assembly protein [Planctomyces sp.]
MQRPCRPAPERHDRSGTVTVELALALPILLMVLFAAVDFARLNVLRNSAENAAYEGARRGILPGATAAQVIDAAQQSLRAVGAVNTQITVTPAVLTSSTQQVTVAVRIPLADNAWTANAARTTKDLVKSCTMSRERTQR